jgi:class 3 adenylate cyclase
MAETRKIAAILAADVVGFSKLTGADEDRTLARLRSLRSDLINPTIAVHHGRVVKRTGDGALVEFRSVVEAVRCAIEMQNGMVERNAGQKTVNGFSLACERQDCRNNASRRRSQHLDAVRFCHFSDPIASSNVVQKSNDR